MLEELIEIEKWLSEKNAKTISLIRSEHFFIMCSAAADIVELIVTQETVTFITPLLDSYTWFDMMEEKPSHLSTVNLKLFQSHINALTRKLIIDQTLKEI